MAKYKVTRGLASDKKNKRYTAGNVVADGDFPKGVIAFWVKEGYLVPIEEKQDTPEPEPAGEDS